MLPIRAMWPSGAALTTALDPMTPAPDLLSTTQDWPQAPCSQAANRRATMSVVPPGGRRHDDAHALGGLPGPVGREAARQQIGHRQNGRSGERGAAGKQAFHGFPRRSLNIVEASRNAGALAKPPHFPYQFVVRLPPIPLISDGVRAKEDYLEETHLRLRQRGAGC